MVTKDMKIKYIAKLFELAGLLEETKAIFGKERPLTKKDIRDVRRNMRITRKELKIIMDEIQRRRVLSEKIDNAELFDPKQLVIDFNDNGKLKLAPEMGLPCYYEEEDMIYYGEDYKK